MNCNTCGKEMKNAAGLAMHMSRVHGIRSEQAEHRRMLKAKRRAKAQAKPEEQPVRKLHSKWTISYCPCCGCNLNLLATALTVASRM